MLQSIGSQSRTRLSDLTELNYGQRQGEMSNFRADGGPGAAKKNLKRSRLLPGEELRPGTQTDPVSALALPKVLLGDLTSPSVSFFRCKMEVL